MWDGKGRRKTKAGAAVSRVGVQNPPRPIPLASTAPTKFGGAGTNERQGVGWVDNVLARVTQSLSEATTSGCRRMRVAVGWSTSTFCRMENKYLAPGMAIAMCRSSPNNLHQLRRDVRLRGRYLLTISWSLVALWGGEVQGSSGGINEPTQDVFLCGPVSFPFLEFGRGYDGFSGWFVVGMGIVTEDFMDVPEERAEGFGSCIRLCEADEVVHIDIHICQRVRGQVVVRCGLCQGLCSDDVRWAI
jgi:hypothetical protein